MLLTDLLAVNQLAAQLKQIDAKIAGAADTQIMVNGAPIPADLAGKLYAAGVPIVQAYFQKDRDAIVSALQALGVTEQ